MTKKEIGEELKMAYAKREWQEEMYNYVDKDLVDSFSYAMKATDAKISALLKMYDNAEDEESTKCGGYYVFQAGGNAKAMSKQWNNYILNSMGLCKGIKKDTAVGKHDSI